MKCKKLQVEHIIKIHNVLVDHYKIPKGHVDKGKIKSLLEKIKFLNDNADLALQAQTGISNPASTIKPKNSHVLK